MTLQFMNLHSGTKLLCYCGHFTMYGGSSPPCLVGRKGWCEEDKMVFNRANQGIGECIPTVGSPREPGPDSCTQQSVNWVWFSPRQCRGLEKGWLNSLGGRVLGVAYLPEFIRGEETEPSLRTRCGPYGRKVWHGFILPPVFFFFFF